MGMSLTCAADYAVRAMVHIACLPEGSVALRSDVAEAQRIPPSFMAKILRRLVQSGLLTSSRGVHGGFALSRDTAEITLLEIVEAIEGPLSLTHCSTDAEACEMSDDCPASLVWPVVQRRLREMLDELTLEALASAPRRHGKVLSVAGLGPGPAERGNGEARGRGDLRIERNEDEEAERLATRCQA